MKYDTQNLVHADKATVDELDYTQRLLDMVGGRTVVMKDELGDYIEFDVIEVMFGPDCFLEVVQRMRELMTGRAPVDYTPDNFTALLSESLGISCDEDLEAAPLAFQAGFICWQRFINNYALTYIDAESNSIN